MVYGDPLFMKPSEVTLWDLARREPVHTLLGLLMEVHCMAYSPDGRWIATGGEGRSRTGPQSEVVIWDAVTGRLIRRLALKGTVQLMVDSLAFHPDGRTLVASDGIRLGVWNTTDWADRMLPVASTGLSPLVVFSPDGQLLATTDGAFSDCPVLLRETSRYTPLRALRGHTALVRDMAFSPDGKRLASASDDRSVKVWDTGTGLALLTIRRAGFEPRSVAFSPDGYLLAAASGGPNGKVLIWDETPSFASFDVDQRLEVPEMTAD